MGAAVLVGLLIWVAEKVYNWAHTQGLGDPGWEKRMRERFRKEEGNGDL